MPPARTRGLLWSLFLACAAAGCGSKHPPPPPGAPQVIATSPADGATGVAIASTVSATLDTAVQPASVTAATFQLATAAGGAVTGQVSATGPVATFVPDAPLANSTTYRATLTKDLAASDGRALAAPFVWSFTTAAPALPPAPSGVTATGGDGTVTVSWAAVAGATSYRLYWSTAAGVTPASGTKIAPAVSPYQHLGLTNGTAYHYVVTAVNAAGEGPPSSEVAATPAPPVPAVPGNLAVTAGNAQVLLTWTAVSGAASYNVYWSNTAGVSKATHLGVLPIAVPSLTHTGLTNGTSYHYVVTAVNLGGESAESAEVSATPVAPTPPGAPTGVAAAPGNNAVTVSWAAVASATSYNLYWSTTSGVARASRTKIAGASSPYTQTGLANGTAYYYVVTAANAAGESADSSEVTATPALPVAPAAPTGVAATAGNATVTISWTAVSGAASYNLYWSTSAGVTKANGTAISGVSNPYHHGGLTNGTTYHYVVTAVNAGGESPISTEVSATPLVVAPAPPTGLLAAAGNGQNTLTWTGSAGATSYNLYWSGSPGVTKANGTKIAGVPSGFVHSGLTNGVAYYYVVTAVNSGGESAESTAASATPVGPVGVPSGVLAIPEDGAAMLSWSPVSGATSYNLYWSVNATVSKASGSPISGVTSGYVHSGLSNGTSYSWVVTAVSASGESAESTVVHATPASLLRPAAIGTSPRNTQVGVPIGAAITVTFSKPMNPASLTPSTFTLAAGAPVTAAVSPSASGYSATLTPTAPLAYATTYTATVTTGATDVTGNAIASNFVFTFTTLPAAPSGLTGLFGGGMASLWWTAVPGATRYQIYRGTTAGGPYSPLGEAAATNFSDFNSGFSPFWVVTALTPAGESPYSNEVSDQLTPGLPGPPTSVIAAPGNGQTVLTWSGSGGYLLNDTWQVLSSTTAGGPYVPVGGPVNSPGAIVRGLPNGTRQYFVVQTVYPGPDAGPWSVEASTVPAAGLAAPTGLGATPGNGWAHLSWTPVAGAAGYLIQRRTTLQPQTNYFATVAKVLTTSYDDLPLDVYAGTWPDGGAAYAYVVAAVDATGAPGAFSSEVAAAPAYSLTPIKPTLTAIASDTRVDLQQAGSNVGTYTYKRAASRDGGYSTVSMTDTTVVNGTTYYYLVTASSVGGASIDSDPVAATPSATPPAAPTNVTGIAGKGYVTLQWDPVPGAASYTVVQSTTNGGPYNTGLASSTLPAASGGNVTNGQASYVVVQAVRGNLTSANSAQLVLTPSASNVGYPTTPANGFPGLVLSSGRTTATVSWVSVTGALSYKIYRSTGGSFSLLSSNASSPYTDSSTSTGAVYAVSAVGASGEGSWSFSSPVSLSAGALPEVTGITVRNGNGGSIVNWNPVPGAYGYVVQTLTAPGALNPGALPSTLGQTTFASAGTNGQTSWVTIQAAAAPQSANTATKNSSDFSVPVAVNPSASLLAAPVPGGLPGDGQAVMSWGPVTNATGYRVYHSDPTSGVISFAFATAATSLIENGLPDGQPLNYLITATNGAVEGPWWPNYQTPLTPAARGLPAPSVVGTSSPGAISLRWAPVPGAASYNVYSSPGPQGPLQLINNYPNYGTNIPSYFGDAQSAAQNGVTTYYAVQAVGAHVGGPIGTVSTPIAITPSASDPPPITLTGSSVGNGEVELSWNPVAGASLYHVYRLIGSPPAWTVVGSPAQPWFTESGLPNGVAALYAIAPVVNGVDEGWQRELSFTPRAAAPFPPGNLIAQPGNGALTVRWDPVAAATTGYQLSCSTVQGQSGNGFSLVTLPNDTQLFPNGVTQYCSVIASASNANSDFSAQVAVTPSASLPPIPGGLQATAGSRQAALAWTAVPDAGSYLVYRVAASGGWTLVGGPAAPAFVDTGLDAGTPYSYAVSAVNGAGSGAWSTIQSATPTP